MPALLDPNPDDPSVHERLLIAAGAHDREGVARALLDGAHPDVFHTQGEFAADGALNAAITHLADLPDRAVMENRYRIVNALLLAGASPDLQSFRHGYPTMQAAFQKQWDVVFRLLNGGASPHRTTAGNNVSLATLALDAGAFEELVHLFEHGVRAQARRIDGSTLLHHLALRFLDLDENDQPMAMGPAQHKMADELLRRGVPLNARTDKGSTALALAVDRGNLALAQHLRARGAHLGGRVPRTLGVGEVRRTVPDLGLMHLAPTVAMARWLIDLGLSVHATTVSGITPLHRVAGHDSPQNDLWCCLLDQGADPFRISSSPVEPGEDPWPTPVEMARRNGHMSLVAEVETRVLRSEMQHLPDPMKAGPRRRL